MAQMQLWPLLQHQCFHNLRAIGANWRRLSTTTATTASSNRSFHFKSRGPKPSDIQESDSDDTKPSRNAKKRDARRAVRWGMDLATFSTPQIKRILRVASVEREVFEALMVVKRLGPDVREGKRRQFNYIGKLLRTVQPELMDALIQASKDGDYSKVQSLSGSSTWVAEDDEEEAEETAYEEEEEEDSHEYIDMATRWFDGLMNKDVEIINEVFSVQSVEFDRQELRKLTRKAHSRQEGQVVNAQNEGQEDAALLAAKKSLSRFLRTLAKQMLDD